MSKQLTWTTQDSVALRELLSRVPEEKLRQAFRDGCPVDLGFDVMKDGNDSSVARLSAMKMGWDKAVDHLFTLATREEPPQSTSLHHAM